MSAAVRERVEVRIVDRPAPAPFPTVSTETMSDDLHAFLEDAKLYRDNAMPGLLVWVRAAIIRLEILLKGRTP